MRSLAIDASTGALGLAVRKDDASAALSIRCAAGAAPVLLPSIQTLMGRIGLEAAELELIVCSVGPGSFTGIRIGLATAKGISFGIPCPLVGVSSLDAFALPYSGFDGDVFPVIDARKGRIYSGLYRGGERIGEYLDVTPAELRERLDSSGRSLLVGPDAEEIRLRLWAPDEAAFRTMVSAAPYADPLALLDAGERKYAREGADPGGPLPLYLRKSEAELASGR
jgi:tRNA threonylcarbamoyladenosine biosynthesis protein TsaB